MRRSRLLAVGTIALLAVDLMSTTHVLAQAPATQVVDIKSAAGVTLKATYFPSTRPGPAIILLHACNKDRTSWTPLATDLAAQGFHVLTLDFRGFGESGGRGSPRTRSSNRPSTSTGRVMWKRPSRG